MSTNGRSREDLAREANKVRTKLLHTVEQLDQRRHEILDVRLQLQRHLRQIQVIGTILLVATVTAIGVVAYRVTTAPERRRRERWKLAKVVWRHPDRALRGERRSFVGTLLRSVLLSVLSLAITLPARRAVVALLPPAVREPHEVH